jgi:AcrR family transcriptional regulator
MSTSKEPDDAWEAAPRGSDPRAARSRAAALVAAQELLVEHGWSAVTHVAVAARSGVGRTTLYRHWADTTTMLKDAILSRIQAAHSAPTGSLREDLIQELDTLRVLLHDPVADNGIRAVIERAGVDPKFAQMKGALYQAGSEISRKVLGEAVDRGELAADLDLDLAIDQLAGPLVYRRLMAGRDFGPDFVSAVVEGFLAGYSIEPSDCAAQLDALLAEEGADAVREPGLGAGQEAVRDPQQAADLAADRCG